MNTIYMDHAATTAVRPEAAAAMIPYLEQHWGNPSSLYHISGAPQEAIAAARSHAAALIRAEPDCIYFTSGGSESDTWALKGVAEGCRDLIPGQREGRHIITTAIEHHAILHAAQDLERQGFCVTYLRPDEWGRIPPESLEAAIRPDTILVSVMMANNEIGTIEPISELSAIAHAHGILFHTDAVQAYGQIPIDVNRQGIDLLSVSAHKLYGPKGIGFLYIRKGLELTPLIFGGGQESGMRGGTENVAAIAGFGEAARLAALEMSAVFYRESRLRDYLIRRVLTQIPFCRLNGSPRNRLPGNANFSFQFVEGPSLLMMLDERGICASLGSACSASSSDPSHVLTAIGLCDSLARSSLRLTLGRETTRREVDTVIAALTEITAQLRSLSDEYRRAVRSRR